MRITVALLGLLFLTHTAHAAELREERIEAAHLTLAVPQSASPRTETADEDSVEWYWYNEQPFLEVFLTAIDMDVPITGIHLDEIATRFADELRADSAIISVTTEPPIKIGGRSWESWSARVSSDPPVLTTDYVTYRGDTALLLLVRYYESDAVESQRLIARMLQQLKVDDDPALAEIPVSAVDFPAHGLRLPLPTGGALIDESMPEVEEYRASEAIAPAAFWSHPSLAWWWMLLQVIQVGDRDPSAVLEEYFPETQLPAPRKIGGQTWLIGPGQDENAAEGGYEVEHALTVAGGRLYMFAFMYVADARDEAQAQLERFRADMQFYAAPLTDTSQLQEFALGALHVSLPQGGDMDVPGDPAFEPSEDNSLVGSWEHPATPVREFRGVVKQVSKLGLGQGDDPLAGRMESIGKKVAKLVGCDYLGTWSGATGAEGTVQTSQAKWHTIVLSGAGNVELVEFFALGPGATPDKYTLYIVSYGYEKERTAEAKPVIASLLETVRWDEP